MGDLSFPNKRQLRILPILNESLIKAAARKALIGSPDKSDGERRR
jgi:hypothetical protein